MTEANRLFHRITRTPKAQSTVMTQPTSDPASIEADSQARGLSVGGRTRQVEHDVLPDGTWRVFKDDSDSGYDPRVRPFYTEAKRAGRLTWLRPYFFLLGSVPGTTCAAPVKDAAGKLRGVLTADFTLAALSEFVAGVSASEHSRVFLF